MTRVNPSQLVEGDLEIEHKFHRRLQEQEYDQLGFETMIEELEEMVEKNE